MKLEKRDALDALDRLIDHCESSEGKTSVKFFSRLQRLRALVDGGTDGSFRRSQLDAKVFSGVAESSLRSLRSEFRKELVACAKEAGLRLTLEIESGRGNDGDEIVCHLEGDSLSSRRLRLATKVDIESVSRDSLSASGPSTYIPMRAWPDEPLVFVSFAVAETDLVDRFMRQLIANLKPRCRHRVRFWRFDEVTAESGIRPGEENEIEIRKAMEKCQFGLLLVSPTYVGRNFIERVELPHFTGAGAKAPAVPVALADWTPGSDKDPRFDAKNVYSLKGKPFNQLSTAKQKAEFIKELAQRIEAFIDHHKAASGIVGTIVDPPSLPARERNAARRHSMGSLTEEERELLEDWYDLDGRPEQQLGRKTAPGPDSVEEISRDGAVDLMTRLTGWASSGVETPAYLALLGETGAGKTMSCLEFTRRLIGDGKTEPYVIYLDLRRANEDGLIKRNERPLLDEIIEAIRRRTGSGEHASVDELLRAVREQRAILIWDGLDEVLVHLSHEAGQAFFRQLLEALPPRLADQPGAGRLVFACRTQYFRDLHHEADLFTGGQKEGIPTDGRTSKKGRITRARFEVLRVLPFSEEQIRGYLAGNVPGIDVDRAFEVIETVHNLRELAGRPYLLSMMRESLTDFDTELASGKRVRSVDLYERLINRWLEREKTREVIGRNHKRRLMQRLAAHFWHEGIRSMPVEDLDQWLEKLVVTDPLFSAAMGGLWQSGSDARDALCEHLRAATFLGRWDGDSFRFAHTSLLEYFLACHLVEALEEGRIEEWALPRPSLETIDFVVERAAVRREANASNGRRMDATLGRLFAKSQPGRSENALAYYVRCYDAGEFLLTPEKIDARGLDLTGWLFAGDETTPIPLPKADFTSAILIRAVFHYTQAEGVCFRGADLCSAEFLNSDLKSADLSDSRLEGARIRACRLSGSHVSGADLRGLRLDLPDWDADTARRWHEAGCLSRGNGAVDTVIPAVDGDPVPPGDPLFSESQTSWSLGHFHWVMSVGFSPDGKHLFSGAMDNTTRLWDAATGASLQVLVGHSRGVISVAFSPDGKRLLSGAMDNTMRLWDAGTGTCLRVLEGHSDWVASVAFSTDGKYILSGARDKTARLWDVGTGACLRVLDGHSDPVTSVAFLANGERLLSGSSDNTMRLWDAGTGSCLRILEGHSSGITSVAISPDGKWLLSGAWDKTVRLWDTGSGACLRVLDGHSGGIMSVTFSPDGKRIFSGSWDQTLRLWDAGTGSCLRILEGHSSGITSVAISPDGKRLLSGAWDKTVRLWDARMGACLRVIDGHSNAVTSVAFLPNRRYILSGAWDKTVRIWDAATGVCLRILEGHSDAVTSVAFSPDGQRLLSGAWDNTLRLWDAASGDCHRIFEGHSNWVTSVAFSPDGERLLSGASDKTLRLWDAATGDCLRVFEGHSNPVTSVAFSPDGQRLLSRGDDNTVRAWGARTGESLKANKDDRGVLEKKRGGLAGGAIWRSPLGTILQTLPDGTERDIAALPDGGYCVLEKKPGGTWRIARAKGEYWRYVNYASDTRPDGTPGRTLYSADLFGPVPEI